MEKYKLELNKESSKYLQIYNYIKKYNSYVKLLYANVRVEN